MNIIRKPGWWLPDREATPEEVFLNRRRLIHGTAAAIGAASLPRLALARSDDPSESLYPFPRNTKYTLDRDITPQAINENYNNFYEFGSYKRVAAAAQALKTRPWTVKISGLVEKPFEIGIDDLLAKMPKEERLYRHRCVEAWAMAVPWSGFPMKAFLDLAKPLSGAKYVEMKTFHNPSIASGQRQTWYPWPYTEGITIAEAANELTFLVTGAYGKPMAKQFGAPLRLALPWKYGFKHIKSIVSVHFTDKRPKGFWEELQPSEYGFWANVNPEVAHPRWSQATEELLGTNGQRVPTKLFNGYGEYVAHLYTGLEKERLWA